MHSSTFRDSAMAVANLAFPVGQVTAPAAHRAAV
jgi:hypothetical protein